VVRVGGQVVSRTLSLQFDGDGKYVEGTFEFETGIVFALAAARDAVGTRKDPVPNVARYNALLSGEEPAPVRGFLVANVRPNGSVNLTGSLPDGTPLKATAHVSEDGGIAVFIPRYRQKLGYLAGNMQITPDEDFPLGGTLDWRKTIVVGRNLPVEFEDVSLEVAGAPYVAPNGPAARNAFAGAEAGGGQLRISEGPFGEPLEFNFGGWAKNKALFVPVEKDVSLTFKPKTGLFSGSYRHTDGKRYPFCGIYVPHTGDGADLAEGFFKGAGGVVEMLPVAN
jgi:hypothetical protein